MQLQKLFYSQEASPKETLEICERKVEPLRSAPLPFQPFNRDTDLLSVILPVEGTLLLALLTGVGRSILLL